MPNFPVITKVPFDPIVFAEPSTSLPVPALFNETSFPAIASGGSAYFCKSPKRFIVDIKMATYSNTDPIPSGPEKGTPTNPTGVMTVWAGP